MHGINTSIPHFFSRVRGTRIVVTPDIVSEVLHVLKVAHPDYPGPADCVKRRTLVSLLWDTFFLGWPLKHPLLELAKGPRFLNMVMTFILHPLSHYNSIMEPRARFLLSLLEDVSINFLSHFILSLIDIYRDRRSMISLFFLQLS